MCPISTAFDDNAVEIMKVIAKFMCALVGVMYIIICYVKSGVARFVNIATIIVA